LQGSKWRLGEFPACTLVAGQRLALICAPTATQPNLLPVPPPDFFRAAALFKAEEKQIGQFPNRGLHLF
jgi:hypothetical protein